MSNYGTPAKKENSDKGEKNDTCPKETADRYDTINKYKNETNDLNSEL